MINTPDYPDDDEPQAGVIHVAEKDLQETCAMIDPPFAKMDKMVQIAKFHAIHWYLAILYFAATTAFWICLGIIPSIGINRGIPIFINVITPPPGNGTGDAFADAFEVESQQISTFPPTVILAVSATVHMLYHGLHSIVYKNWVAEYLNRKSHPYRWFGAAITKTLEFSVLFVWNGERELTSLLFLAGSITGCCFIAHALDESIARYCDTHGAMKDSQSSSYVNVSAHVRDYGRDLGILSTLIAVAFIFRLGYNHQSTPHWVTGLSISLLVWEFFWVAYYIHSSWQSQCNKESHRLRFMTGDWRFMWAQFVGFVVLSATAFAEQSKM